jgi:asparagine synthase (glutamine-hydrolysing)
MSGAHAETYRPPAAQAPVQVRLGPGWGWTACEIAGADVWIKGWLLDGTRTVEGTQAAAHAARIVAAASGDGALKSALAGLSGHFALVIRTPERTVACVDRVRTCPLVWAQKGGTVHVDDRGQRLRDALGLGIRDLDSGQVLACATGGWTIGGATLYRGLNLLLAGQALVADARGARTLEWFIYDAWNTETPSQPEKELSELHRRMIDRLAAAAGGRAICVPLSAGLDSRMIAAGLRSAGYKDVRLFSYGRPGNHEAETARLIAERLGYPWTFVPFSGSMQRAMFADPVHERALWQEADTCACIPFEQDWLAVSALKASGWMPADAMIVNGQSGDFITGNHVPGPLIDAPASLSPEMRRERVYSAYIAKHHSLWGVLGGGPVRTRIEALLDAEVGAAGASFADERPYGIYEHLEYQDRQSKYVVSGQRTYEALNMAWRLPLWDDDYVLFWRRVPLALKANQNLYRRVLQTDNWGDVWRDVPVNAKTIRPRWIVPLRLAAKAAMAPFGRERWHRAEKRLFGWWMDPLRISAFIPYSRALADNRRPRHASAWLAERYLAQHGVAVNDLVRTHAGAP